MRLLLKAEGKSINNAKIKKYMKTILNTEGANDLTRRANSLKQTSEALWGTMSVTEMLHHCNRATQSILEGKAAPQNSNFKQKVLKFLFMNVIKKLPKNATAPKRFNMKLGQLTPGEFQSEQQEFLRLINRFTSHPNDITLSHPRFGALTTKEWGKFVWMHLDHHLRQFGV
jgi:hypothetical protein